MLRKTDEAEKPSVDFETFKALLEATEKEFEEKTTIELSLSDFSTTQLKAELRRRKKEKRGYM